MDLTISTPSSLLFTSVILVSEAASAPGLPVLFSICEPKYHNYSIMISSVAQQQPSSLYSVEKTIFNIINCFILFLIRSNPSTDSLISELEAHYRRQLICFQCILYLHLFFSLLVSHFSQNEQRRIHRLSSCFSHILSTAIKMTCGLA